MDGDAPFVVRGCVVFFPVVDEEVVLRDEALDHLKRAPKMRPRGMGVRRRLGGR